MRVSALGLAIATAMGCASGPSVRGVRSTLLVRGEPAEARVYVDDEYAGTARALRTRPLPLPPGPHRLQVEHDGYFPYYGEVDLGGVQQTIEIRLVERPD